MVAAPIDPNPARDKKSFFEISDYREILRAEFQSRNSRSTAYSLRAFARDMGISSAQLSEIFKQKTGLSRTLAEKMAPKLGLDAEETKYFLDLISSEYARSHVERRLAADRLKQYRQSPVRDVSARTIDLLTKWYYPALIEMIEVFGGRMLTDQFARALKIPSDELESAVRELVEVGFLRKEGDRLSTRNSHVFVQSATPSERIRAFHKAVLERAIAAIDEQSMDHRKCLTSTISFRSASMESALKEIESFDRTFVDRYSTEQQPDSVYCLSVQFFRLIEKGA